MPLTYAVVQTPAGWSVCEDGLPIDARDDKGEAVEIAHLLTVATRAAGGQAKLLVQADCGRLERWDVDCAMAQLNATFAESRTPRAARFAQGGQAS